MTLTERVYARGWEEACEETTKKIAKELLMEKADIAFIQKITHLPLEKIKSLQEAVSSEDTLL